MAVEPIPAFWDTVTPVVEYGRETPPTVDPDPITTNVAPTETIFAFVITPLILTELPTETSDVLLTKNTVDPTPTVCDKDELKKNN